MKILWVSDSVWTPTGYGVTSKQICKRMVEDGHTVYNYAPGAFSYGETVTPDGITVLSSFGGDDRCGSVTLPYHLRRFQPDVIITWLDAHGLTAYGLDTYPLWVWAPIDTWPVPEQELSILGRAEKVLVPSRWGQQVLAEQGVKAEYVPCGFSPKEFYPDPHGRMKWRAMMPGVDDTTYVIGMVGINAGSPDRKGFGYAFDVIKKVKERIPKLKAYIHTNPNSDAGSIDLGELTRAMGLQDTIIFPPQTGPQGWPVEYMRHLYNGIDVLLHTSLTEGFGMPVVEAQACGTPVVVNSATSVTELVFAGKKVEPLASMWLNTCTQVAIPDVEKLADAVHESWLLSAYPPTGRISLEFGEQDVYERYWRPLLAETPKHLEVARPDGRNLILGAGAEKKENCVHHDKEKYQPHHELAFDLEALPWPLEDDGWDYIEMSDVIEHLNAPVVDVMNELWRAIAPGGYLLLHTVKAGSWQEKHDPTHTRGFELTSFDYFDPETAWGEQYTYTDKRWRIVKRTLDETNGILLVMQPRKAPETHDERLYGRDVLVAV